MEDILVSIVTPSFNSSKFIFETIKSIQEQTIKNWELLITDDCSSDNSYEIIKNTFISDPRIKVFKLEKNSGAGAARNNSIEKAKGRYIAFCDSDDRWYPSKLEEQIRFMQEKDCFLSYSSYDTCNEKGEIIGFVRCLPSLNYYKIIRDNGIGCLTAIYDTQKIGKHYFPLIRKRQDWSLWIKIIKEHGDAFGLDKPLALYRVREDSISSNKMEMLKYNYNVYHEILGYNKVKSAMILGLYFMPYYFYKKIKQKIDYKKS